MIFLRFTHTVTVVYHATYFRRQLSSEYVRSECLIASPILLLSDKDGKAFHPTYEEKLRLVALHKQVLLGPYNPDASPDVGFFDVLGNDRR